MAKARTEMTAGLLKPRTPAAPGGKTLPLPRRTFAIISHPDAGKTTLTEKLLRQQPHLVHVPRPKGLAHARR